MIADYSAARRHIQPASISWPEEPEPGILQLVVRGSKKNKNQAFWELVNENRAEIPDEWLSARDWDETAILGKIGGMEAVNKLAVEKGITAAIPDNLGRLFPNLRQLHLWKVEDLTTLPALPQSLEVLDIRDSPALQQIGALPPALTTLVLERCPALTLEAGSAAGVEKLKDLSVAGSPYISDAWLSEILKQNRSLEKLNASGGPQLKIFEVGDLPATLVDLRLHGWNKLKKVEVWPPGLRRLELRGASGLAELPDLPETLDFLDVGAMAALAHLPKFAKRPRTLRISRARTGLHLPGVLHGDDAETNVAEKVWAYLDEMERSAGPPDNEVKLLLIGNGRCGKTSLVKRLFRLGSFNRREVSTHGIRLWKKRLPFQEAGCLPQKKDSFWRKFLPFLRPKAEVNAWDFGGQDLYHNTHRLFLESKAVFLICHTAPDQKGADEKTDAEAAADPYLDKEYPIEYWQAQVTSLDPAPGRTEGPPRIGVFTKADRDPAGKLPEDLAVSSRTGTGFAGLRKQLETAIGEALGPAEKRRLPKSAWDVKKAIQKLKGKRRYITRKEFADLVTQHAPESVYAEKPELLVDWFHRSGLIYYRKELGEKIILDQRWALDGIYAVFHRKHCWENLQHKNGQFTADYLHERVWKELNYTKEDESLFIDFMLACKICFELLPRWETPDGKAVYVAVGALPEEAPVLPPENRQDGKNATVTRHAMAGLVTALGAKWRRSAQLWQWGAQIQSYGQGEGLGRSWVRLQWEAKSEMAFEGLLKIELYGTNTEFFQAVVDFCESQDGGKLETFVPSAAEATGVHIGVSYAGGGAYVKDWRMLPAQSEERWPRAIAEAFRNRGYTVEDYRLEQGRSRNKKTFRGRDYLEYVASRDFMVLVVGNKYLESSWCMYEAMRTWERFHESHINRAWVAMYSTAYVSENTKEFTKRRKKFLSQWQKEFIKWDKDNGGKDSVEEAEEKETSDCKVWFQFAARSEKLRKLWVWLMKAARFDERLDTPEVDESQVETWVNEMIESMQDPKTREQMAREVWKSSEPDREKRAAALLLESYRMRYNEAWRTELMKPGSDDSLEPIRRYARTLVEET